MDGANQHQSASRADVACGRQHVAWSVLVALTLLFPCAAFAADTPVSSKPEAAPSAPPAVIPTPEVVSQAAQVLGVIRVLAERLAPREVVEAIAKRLPDLREEIAADLERMVIIPGDQPTLDALQAQLQTWQRRQLAATQALNILTQEATRLQEALTWLAETRQTWRRTLSAATAANAPVPVLRQIDAVLSAIAVAETPLEAQRAALLDLQSAVGLEVARCGNALSQLTQAQHRAMGGILTRDNPPIWSFEGWRQARVDLPARIRNIAALRWQQLAGYARDPSNGLVKHGALLVLLGAVLWVARLRVRQWSIDARGMSVATRAFERPYSATVVTAMIIVSSPWSSLPSTARFLVTVLGLAVVIRLMRPWTDPRLARGLYGLWVLFAVDSVRAMVAGTPMIEQALLALEMLAGMTLLAHSLRWGSLRRPTNGSADAGRLPALRLGAGLVVLTFAVAAAAAILGYMRLARLLASGVLASGALAVTLYALVEVLSGAVAFSLQIWPLRLLRAVDRHRPFLERRIRRALIVAALAAWIARTLDHVGLLQPALSLGQAVLATDLGRGSIRLSVGSLVEFLLTVCLAYLVSAFIRWVLVEDVYPHTRLTRGMSYAISSLLNYVIVGLGFVLALGALGLDLTKVTVLAGAFGVGIGFGLQSVVNNFVSGLILLFERPIHVGDIIEVGNLSGEVSRIGIRASTVRTWQGAEMIVPNAQLVTERVTNWTLSDRARRIDLSVGVDYDTPPERVLELLEEVARAHSEVLSVPAPKAVFIGFGDSAINYELRAWTSRFERWSVVETELAAAVYRAVRAAGMALPFPQRVVRVLGDGPGPTATPRGGPASPAP